MRGGSGNRYEEGRTRERDPYERRTSVRDPTSSLRHGLRVGFGTTTGPNGREHLVTDSRRSGLIVRTATGNVPFAVRNRGYGETVYDPRTGEIVSPRFSSLERYNGNILGVPVEMLWQTKAERAETTLARKIERQRGEEGTSQPAGSYPVDARTIIVRLTELFPDDSSKSNIRKRIRILDALTLENDLQVAKLFVETYGAKEGNKETLDRLKGTLLDKAKQVIRNHNSNNRNTRTR
jgi:hypothetical protein